MASFLFGLWALLAVSIIRASSGAAGRILGQQLVAVQVSDLEIIVEQPVLARRQVGEAESADRRLPGIFGISCALANGEAAAASAFFVDSDDERFPRTSNRPLARPSQRDTVNVGSHKSGEGICSSALRIYADRSAAVGCTDAVQN